MQSVLNYYQLVRNVYHLNPDDLFVVVAPEGNIPLKEKFDVFYQEILMQKVKDQVRFMSWEEMLFQMRNRGGQILSHRIIDQLDEFEDKYLKY